MAVLVTGSSGHLGEAIMRTLRVAGRSARGFDIKPSPFTDVVGSITDRRLVTESMDGVDAVIHSATLHKPHVGTHSSQNFVDVNVTGTLALLEAARAAQVRSFVFTSTTSTFGSALTPAEGEPAAWIDENVVPVPKNIYGATKTAAEGLCELFARQHGLATVILRTSRFFPEPDDDPQKRARYALENAQANELLYRRADIEDVVSAHVLAAEKAPEIGFGRYIVSATTPFGQDDLAELRYDAPRVLARYFPDYRELYDRRGWSMFPQIDRVYANHLARRALGWQPKYDFAHVLRCHHENRDFRSDLTHVIGSKGYHDRSFTEGPYPAAP